MKVYLVQEDIDLGYHTRSVWIDKSKADVECDTQNAVYRARLPAQKTSPFWVEEHAVRDA